MSYCDFYKWFLVEELALTFPEQFHYGKCSVIGRLSIQDDSIFINNVRIKGVDSKYQLDDGKLRLKASWSLCDQVPVYNEPVEVYGEAVFHSKHHGTRTLENILPMTAKEANRLCPSSDSRAKFWSDIKDQYEPAVKVHSYRLITQTDRLIACNLRLRTLDKLRELRTPLERDC